MQPRTCQTSHYRSHFLTLLGLIVALLIQSCLSPAGDSKLSDPNFSQTGNIGAKMPPVRLWHNIPKRAANALTGSQFLAQTKNLSPSEREKAILRQLRRGNVPLFQRSLRALSFPAKVRGKVVAATIWVLPDYLAIGSDQDFVRMPMTPMSAQRLADQFGLMLPTKRMVDLIYQYAAVKLSPQPLSPGPKMSSNDYYLTHHQKVQAQFAKKSQQMIIAGHKKDVVISNRLNEKRGRVAIYGWHRSVGNPIQPLSIVHDQYYADYSHGIRLIAPTMVVDQEELPVSEVLEDRALAQIISDEGPVWPLRARTE